MASSKTMVAPKTVEPMKYTKAVKKVYKLIDIENSAVPIYTRVNNSQRVRYNGRPFDHAHLQVPVIDEEGRSRTLRYKRGCDVIYVDEQMKLGIDATARFTTAEKDDVMFRNGFLTTDKATLQKFLEASPEFDGFKGQCDEIRRPKFTIYDKTKETRSEVAFARKQAEAMSKMFDLTKDQIQSLMILLNGSWYKTPDDISDCQKGMIDFINAAEEEAALDAIIAFGDEEHTEDEEVKILIGKAINLGLLSFDEKPGQVMFKPKDEWVSVKQLAESIELEEKQRLFSIFLLSPEGLPLAENIEKLVNERKN